MEDKDRFIDELLDAALARQHNAEPQAGVETRILERVRTSATGQSSRRRAWVVVTAVAAAAFLVVMVRVANRSHSPAVQTPQISKVVPSPQPNERLAASSETARQPGSRRAITTTERTEHHQRKTSGRTVARHWPSQFPTPTPLSPEERALVRYVQETPPQVLAASLFKEQSVEQPLEIKPLKIVPLEIRPLSLGSKQEEMQ